MIAKTFLRDDPTVFIVCKHTSDSAVRGAASIIKWFQKYKPKAQLLAGPRLQSRLPSSLIKSAHSTISFICEESETELKDANLIVSCGGDGSLLHISSIFQNEPCPPVLPFSLGSLGFLSSFDFPDYKLVLNRLFKDKFTLLQRNRLQIESEAIPNGKRVILNEILLNRSTANVPEFEFSIKDDSFFFPSAIADAMILASATGSTGHSLSAGGPILHPTLNCGVLNFLAPRTLSGRPLILPLDSHCSVKMGLSLESRAEEVDIHLDGVSVGNLKKGQLIKVTRAQHPFSVFSFFGPTADWNNRLSNCLKWNQPYENTAYRIK